MNRYAFMVSLVYLVRFRFHDFVPSVLSRHYRSQEENSRKSAKQHMTYICLIIACSVGHMRSMSTKKQAEILLGIQGLRRICMRFGIIMIAIWSSALIVSAYHNDVIKFFMDPEASSILGEGFPTKNWI